MMETFSNYAYGEPVRKVVELGAQFLNDLAVISLRVIPVLYWQDCFIPAYTGKFKLTTITKAFCHNFMFDIYLPWLIFFLVNPLRHEFHESCVMNSAKEIVHQRWLRAQKCRRQLC